MNTNAKNGAPYQPDSRGQLLAYTTECLARIERNELAGSHLLGVATKAIKLFEGLLKDTLGTHLALCAVTYEEVLKPTLHKPFEKLTLGELVNCLRMLNGQVTRGREPDSLGHRDTRRTVTKILSRKLDAICRLRADVVAHYRSEEMEPAGARQLLKLINEVLEDSIFNP